MKDFRSDVENDAEDVLERRRHLFLVVWASHGSESCQ